MKRYALAVAVLLLSVGGAAIGQSGSGSTWGLTGPGMRANLARHHVVMMYGIPVPYRSLIDPFPRTRAKLNRGAAVFQRNCAACHGLSGRGEGAERQRLWPPPRTWPGLRTRRRAGPILICTGPSRKAGRPSGPKCRRSSERCRRPTSGRSSLTFERAWFREALHPTRSATWNAARANEGALLFAAFRPSENVGLFSALVDGQPRVAIGLLKMRDPRLSSGCHVCSLQFGVTQSDIV